MEWINENWAVITTILGIAAAILKHLGKAKYGKIIESIVLQIEYMEPNDSRVLKKRIKTINIQQGTEVALHAIVKKATE